MEVQNLAEFNATANCQWPDVVCKVTRYVVANVTSGNSISTNYNAVKQTNEQIVDTNCSKEPEELKILSVLSTIFQDIDDSL